MSSETSASETTPLRRPDSRNSEAFFTTTETPTTRNNAHNVINANNVPHLTQPNTTTAEPNNRTTTGNNNNNNYNNNTEIHINHNSYSNNNNGSFLPRDQEPQQLRAEHPESTTTIIKMDTNIRILCRVGLDILILLCVGFPILGFYLWGDSYKRGFFCDDESLKHPFKDSTIRNWMLYFIGVFIPIAVMFSVELIRSQQLNKCSGTNGRRRYVFMDYEIPDWLVECYKKIGIFGFGAGVSQLTTDIAKYSIGRLRPHFFAVCQPQLQDGSTCADPINAGRYIVDFTCAGVGSTARMLKEVRLSFPSGHSSFTFFTMVYVALYLQSRMCWRGSKLLRHFLQFLVIMVAWYTALSRVSDYKHHWSDVLAGSAIGALTAIIVANYISDLFDDDDKTKSYTLPQTLHDVPAPPSPPQMLTTNGH